MRRTARLIVTALVLLAAMSVGAFAASSPAGISPRASDLPKIVTALTLPASSTVAVTATAPTTSPSPSSGAKAPGPSAASPSARAGTRGPTSSGSSASSGSSKSDSSAAASRSDRSHDSHDSDHEVVAPKLHESDGHSGEQGHSSGD